MSRIRKRHAGFVGIVVAVSAMLVLAFGGSNASAVKVVKRFTLNEASVTFSENQGSGNDDYIVKSVTKSCPAKQKAVSASGFWSIPNSTATDGISGANFLTGSVRKIGEAYTAEALSDFDGDAPGASHTFTLQVVCAKRVSV